MSVLKDDFIGFSYNGVHSSDLGIMRVSDGSRFNEDLLPVAQDVTVQVPGGDGTYYFGSYYTQRQLSISFAFDELTETRFEFMKELFGDKKIHPLIFDEKPYKTYYAKVSGLTTIKYVPFTEKGERVYKGEGTFEFVCYEPFAVCSKKYLSEYENTAEWAGASNLLSNSSGIDTLQNGAIKVYNPGVKESDWILSFEVAEDGLIPGGILNLDDYILKFAGCSAKYMGNSSVIRDSIITFDSKNRLIEGWVVAETDGNGNVKYEKSGNIYNEFIYGGDFFNIPITISRTLNGVNKNTKNFYITAIPGEATSLANCFKDIKYNYYFF